MYTISTVDDSLTRHNALPAHQNHRHNTTFQNLRKQVLPSTFASGLKRTFNDYNESNLVKPNLGDLNQQREPEPHIPKPRLQASKITKLTEQDYNESFPRVPSTPSASQHPLLSLAHSRYGLPLKLVSNFESLGVRAIYPWQSSCLLGRGVLDGVQNLIYTAPTGGGKSLVADVLLIKKIIENPRKKAILVLPYVALVQEKSKWLRRLVEGLDHKTKADEQPHQSIYSTHEAIRVAAFYGGSRSKTAWPDCDIAVCTIEKANMLINSAIEEGTINDLGIIVLDELHMLDDEHRGYIMELLITKVMLLQNSIQVIGMSATLSNPELLAKWLQAKFYIAKYRPIPIEEHLVYENAIYSTANSKDFFHTATQLGTPKVMQNLPQASHVIEQSVHKELADPMTNAVVALAIETAISGFGALVFSSSRQGTQNMALLISQAMPTDGTSIEVLNQRQEILATLQALSSGFETTLAQTLPYGVAFHHAGLTFEEKDIIAEAYEKGTIKILVATCSLAAGINLPARRVILRGARMGRDLVGPAMLRQMRGRAGRKGKDEIGETYLCCQKADLEAVAELIEAELTPVGSCLTPEKRGLKRAILEVIATRLANCLYAVKEYVMSSLLWYTTDQQVVMEMLGAALESLVTDRLVKCIDEDIYTATSLGIAVVAAGLSPEDGLFVHSDLRRALSSFVMDSELHIFYLFTPIPQPSPSRSLSSEISFPVFRNCLDTLDEPSLRALRRIGVNPAHINRLVNSGSESLPESTPDEINTARIYRRAYSAFALRDFCNELSIHSIAEKYDLPRGTIQNLAQTCHGFAAGMIKFCQRMSQAVPPTFSGGVAAQADLPSTYAAYPTISDSSAVPADPQATGFSMLAAVLTHMQSRLYAGARADLLEMAQVTFVKGRMARMLYENGFKSVRAIAEADVYKDLLPILRLVSGYKLGAPPIVRNRGLLSGDEYEQQQRQQEQEWQERKAKLEEKLIEKAEVMVRSASKIWEREALRGVLDEE